MNHRTQVIIANIREQKHRWIVWVILFWFGIQTDFRLAGIDLDFCHLAVAQEVSRQVSDGPDDEAFDHPSWTFSRRDDVNFDNWPDNWQRRIGRRYPKYVDVQIVAHDEVTEQHLRAIDTAAIRYWPRLRSLVPILPTLPPSMADVLVDRFLRIQLDGGLVMVQSPPMKTSQRYQYRFSLRAMTQGLRFDRARAELVFVDKQGDEVSVKSSEPISGTTTWKYLVVDKVRAPRSATQMYIRLIVEAAEDGLEDIRGTIGFDDLKIEQFPQLQLTTINRSGLYKVGQPIEVTAQVLGLPTDTSNVQFSLFDANRKPIASQLVPISSLTPAELDGQDDAGMQVKWNLPRLQPGLFYIAASLKGKTLSTLATETTVAVVDTLVDGPPHGPFGLTLRKPDDLKPRELVSWLNDTGVGWVKYPCWVDPDDYEKATSIAETCGRIQEAGIETIGLLDRPPEDQVHQYDLRARQDMVASQLFRDVRIWKPHLESLMTRMTIKIRTWQLGDDRDHSFLGRSQLRESIEGIAEGLQGYGQPIEIAICWPWTEPRPTQEETAWQAICQSADPSLTADELDAYLRRQDGPRSPSGRSSSRRSPHTWTLIDPIPASRFDRDTRILDLIRRMATVRKHRVQAAFISNPRDREKGLLRSDGRPSELLLPWRTTSRLIGDLRQAGSLRLRCKANNIVFFGPTRTVVMLWSEEPKVEKIYFGDDAKIVDVWGRTQSLKNELVDGRQVQVVPIDRLPRFVVDADPAILAFRMSVEVERSELDSLLGQKQTLPVSFVNPTREGLVGSVAAQGPDQWNFRNPVEAWELSASRSTTQPFEVVLGNSAKVGTYELALHFEHQTVPPKQFTVYREVSVGPTGLTISASTKLMDNGELEVEIEMTNLSSKSLSYDCMLFPGAGRQYERKFITIGAGTTTRRVFYFSAARSLVGKTMLLRAGEEDGLRILNYEFTVHR